MGHIFTTKCIRDERRDGGRSRKEQQVWPDPPRTCLSAGEQGEKIKPCSRASVATNTVGVEGSWWCTAAKHLMRFSAWKVKLSLFGQDAATQWHSSVVSTKGLYHSNQWKMKLVRWHWLAQPSIKCLLSEQLGPVFWP